MPSWWGKSSCIEVKQNTDKRSFIDSIRKLKRHLETGKSGGSQRYCIDICSEKETTPSASALPSLQVSRCHSFTDHPQAQPLPRPRLRSETCAYSPPRHRHDSKHPHAPDAWGDLATASVSSNSSFDTNDQPGSQLLSLQASDYESGNVTAISSPSRHKDHSSIITRRILKDQLKPYNLPGSDQIPLTSTERKPFGAQVTKLQITPRAGFFSAPDSSTTSPSKSKVKACTRDQLIKYGSGVGTPCSNTNLVGSGHCCYLSSDQISGPNQVTEMSFTRPHSRCSPEYSPIPSPRMTSPGRSYHIQSGSLCRTLEKGTAYRKWETGEMCAMKEVTLFSDDSKSKESAQQLEHEITLLSRLRHPNIVRYFGSEMVDEKLCIYLEYVSGGSINKILREYGALGESAIRSYTQQILSGLVYLHSKNTVHRDIKGANILVDPNGRVKLADFGMAKHITGQSCPFSFKGSPYWMAPEVIKNSSGCNLAVDIWSLGCTVIEMATTKPPWNQYEGVAALFKIGNSKEHPPTPDHLSEEGKDFVWRCLQRNPQDRPTAIQLLEHPFVRNVASPERWMIISDPKPHHTANYADKYRDNGHAKKLSSLDLEGVAVQLSRGVKNGSESRNIHRSKNISCPVSPIRSPLLHPKASEPMCRRSTIASSQTASCSSTPRTNDNVAFPVNRLDYICPYPHDVMVAQRPHKSLYVSGDPLFCKRKLETLSDVPETSQVNGNVTSCQSDLAGSKPVHLFQKPGACNRQSVLARRVSQQLLMDHLS
ncbi:Mitogen-activated protein kinase kinase kinase YODA [Bienertia sinuspersici]